MALVWLIVCIFWHFNGEVPTVAWLLLIPMFIQDMWDVANK
jgi:hypothetical protein